LSDSEQITEDERTLIENCQNKNTLKAKESLYRHFYGYAMSISLRYASTENEAIMIVNDSFIKVFEHLDSYDSEYSFKSWLRKIIINTSIDKYRKEMKRYQKEVSIPVSSIPTNYADIISKLTAQDILRLLKELPEDQRLIFNLYEIEGYSHKEIAEKLDITASTSRSYLSRAKAKLRTLFNMNFKMKNEFTF